MLPLALFLIFLILYFQFKQVPTTLLVFSGIVVAWAGGFLMIWAYGQDWFLDFDVFGVNMRELFQVHTINLSVAIWVGFLALFGIASDDGVVIATYLDQSFGAARIETVEDARAATARGRPAAGPALPDDDGDDDPGPDPGADLHRPGLGHHGADGHPQLRRHGSSRS